MRLKVKQHHFF